jgi:hypothetical protein
MSDELYIYVALHHALKIWRLKWREWKLLELDTCQLLVDRRANINEAAPSPLEQVHHISCIQRMTYDIYEFKA